MDLFSIFLLAIGLSFDSFAVSISSGLSDRKIIFWNACKIAFSLAFFQALFPLFGWLIGMQIQIYVERFDHWIAFLLLLAIGSKMVFDQFKQKYEEKESLNPLKLSTLIGISVATSIDAFVVGIGFGFIQIKILLAAFIIGLITFIISMTGILFGKKTAGKFGDYANVFGGIILIGIGIKILIEHTA